MKALSRHFLFLTASMLALPAAVTVPALAQGTQQAQGGGLEEIVVTARKRQELILKVPVVETAITQHQMEQYAVIDLQSLSVQVPDLLFGNATGAFGAQVSIRGVGTSTLNAAIDQSVSLNLDGLQVSQGLAYQSGLFDLAQAEVLKGPQALFYGKSSPGGVISLRTADPTDEFEVIARMGWESEANEKKGEFIVSGPVTDTLSLRLATMISGMDGFFENDGVGIPSLGGLTPRFHNFAPENDYLVRGTAIWKPSDQFDLKAKANFSENNINGDGGGLQYASCPGGTVSNVGIPFIPPQEDCKIDRVIRLVDLNPAAFPAIRNGGTPFDIIRQTFGSAEANYYVLDDLTLTSVTGLYEIHQPDMIDGTEGEAAGATLVADNNFHRRDLSEELRLASDFKGPVNFTAGAYVQDGVIDNNFNLLGNTFLQLPATLQKGSDHIGIRSDSLFGQVRWKALENVELAGGVRWSYEQRTLSEINLQTGMRVPLAQQFISSYHLNPEFTVTYTPTDTLTLFGSYKEASKSGSFDVTTLYTAGQNNSFGDEGVTGGEVGAKAALLDRTVRINFDAYDYNYKNLQVGANVVTPQGGIIERTQNAATAEIYGIDLDGAYYMSAIPGLILRGAGNWNHARFGAFGNAPCWGGQTISEGCNQVFSAATGLFTAQNLSGRPLVRAPDWSLSFGFDYETPVGTDLTLAIGSNTDYTSSYYTNLIERSDTIQGAFFKTNLSIALRGPDDDWEVAFIGNNLNNTLTTGNCVNAPFNNGVILGGAISGGVTRGPNLSDGLVCDVDRGRELWLRLTVKLSAFVK